MFAHPLVSTRREQVTQILLRSDLSQNGIIVSLFSDCLLLYQYVNLFSNLCLCYCCIITIIIAASLHYFCYCQISLLELLLLFIVCYVLKYLLIVYFYFATSHSFVVKIFFCSDCWVLFYFQIVTLYRTIIDLIVDLLIPILYYLAIIIFIFSYLYLNNCITIIMFSFVQWQICLINIFLNLRLVSITSCLTQISGEIYSSVNLWLQNDSGAVRAAGWCPGVYRALTSQGLLQRSAGEGAQVGEPRRRVQGGPVGQNGGQELS